jgi:hypothetical protein
MLLSAGFMLSAVRRSAAAALAGALVVASHAAPAHLHALIGPPRGLDSFAQVGRAAFMQ